MSLIYFYDILGYQYFRFDAIPRIANIVVFKLPLFSFPQLLMKIVPAEP
jgi:hypothetical protein